MRKSPVFVLLVAAFVAACKEEDACFDTLSCPRADTTTGGGTSGSAGTGTGGSAGTGSTSSGGTGVSALGGSTGIGGSSASAGGSGGTGGTLGGASGAGGAPACDGACNGSTPVCDETTDTCVECLDSSAHCAAPTPACHPGTHECVECVETADCDEGVCDPEAHACVECLETADCADPTPLCDTEQQVCSECLANADCTSPLEATCDGGSCRPCQSNADCEHLAGATVCDVAAGECVECTVEEQAVCGGTSCNPATRTCTTTALGSRDDCEPCVADSECIGNSASEAVRRCIPMEFAGELRAQAYCLRREEPGRQRPFTVLVTAASVSGAAEETYCGIAQNLVTCEAVLDLFQSRACPGGADTECGCPRDQDGNCTATGQGGLCRRVGGIDNQCTYQCGVANNCPSTSTCANQDPDFCQ